jgi:transcription termination factor Rho
MSEDLKTKTVAQLQEIAASRGVSRTKGLKKADLIAAISGSGGSNGSSRSSGNGNGRATTKQAAPAASPETQASQGGGSRDSNRGTERGERREQSQSTERPNNERQQENRGGQENRSNDRQDRPDRQGGDRQFNRQQRQQGNFQNPRHQGGQGGGFDDRRGDRRRRKKGKNRGSGGGGGGGGGGLPQGSMDREWSTEELESEGAALVSGVLDVMPDGYGFVRAGGYMQTGRDAYVPQQMIRRLSLRKGDEVRGYVRPLREGDRYAALLKIDAINDKAPELARHRVDFKDLTPLFPDERFHLEWGPKAITERVIDLISPIGRGQRCLIVSPPKAGKTTVLKQIANGIRANSKDVHLIVLLVDERPEEVTDWRRTVKADEVAFSTFDRPATEHTQVAELVLARAQRLVELGRDVVIMLDSITRLARAYNLAAPVSGRILSGGVDSGALYPPKKFFGAARNIEEGGSLTIVASALVDTGSKMDEVIFEEFKGTGNSEIRLDRGLSEKRIFPAIDIEGSSTRKEELLYTREELPLVWRWRRLLAALEPRQAMELLRDKMLQTENNAQLLVEISKMKNVD